MEIVCCSVPANCSFSLNTLPLRGKGKNWVKVIRTFYFLSIGLQKVREYKWDRGRWHWVWLIKNNTQHDCNGWRRPEEPPTTIGYTNIWSSKARAGGRAPKSTSFKIFFKFDLTDYFLQNASTLLAKLIISHVCSNVLVKRGLRFPENAHESSVDLLFSSGLSCVGLESFQKIELFSPQGLWSARTFSRKRGRRASGKPRLWGIQEAGHGSLDWHPLCSAANARQVDMTHFIYCSW